MRYYRISEEDLLRLLRDSLTLKEIQSIKPVSEDLAELELSKFLEVNLIQLLRDSLTLKEIQAVKTVSEEFAKRELPKFFEIPADAGFSAKINYDSKKPKYPECSKPFYFVEIEPGRWKRVDKVPPDCLPVLGDKPKTKWYSEPLGVQNDS